jgi:hypothetical protein
LAVAWWREVASQSPCWMFWLTVLWTALTGKSCCLAFECVIWWCEPPTHPHLLALWLKIMLCPDW